MDVNAGRLEFVELSKLYVSPFALRQPQRDSDTYKDLVKSIAARGIGQPPIVRSEKKGTDKWQEGHRFEIGDGCQRKHAAEDAGLKTIPVIINDTMTDEDIQTLQVQLNTQGVKTTKKQIAQAMERYMTLHNCSIQDLAVQYSKSLSWVENHLNLRNLDERINTLFERGTLPATIAYQLSKLDPDTQFELCKGEHPETKGDSICAIGSTEAVELISKLYKEEQAEKRGHTPEFEPRSKFIGKKNVMIQAEAAEEAGDVRFAEGLRASVQLDTESISNQEKEWKAAQDEKKAKKLQKARKAAQERDEEAKRQLEELEAANA